MHVRVRVCVSTLVCEKECVRVYAQRVTPNAVFRFSYCHAIHSHTQTHTQAHRAHISPNIDNFVQWKYDFLLIEFNFCWILLPTKAISLFITYTCTLFPHTLYCFIIITVRAKSAVYCNEWKKKHICCCRRGRTSNGSDRQPANHSISYITTTNFNLRDRQLRIGTVNAEHTVEDGLGSIYMCAIRLQIKYPEFSCHSVQIYRNASGCCCPFWFYFMCFSSPNYRVILRYIYSRFSYYYLSNYCYCLSIW